MSQEYFKNRTAERVMGFSFDSDTEDGVARKTSKNRVQHNKYK